MKNFLRVTGLGLLGILALSAAPQPDWGGERNTDRYTYRQSYGNGDWNRGTNRNGWFRADRDYSYRDYGYRDYGYRDNDDHDRDDRGGYYRQDRDRDENRYRDNENYRPQPNRYGYGRTYR